MSVASSVRTRARLHLELLFQRSLDLALRVALANQLPRAHASGVQLEDPVGAEVHQDPPFTEPIGDRIAALSQRSARRLVSVTWRHRAER